NLLNHLLQLIDGVVKSEGIYIIGATNRVELVDSAQKRAGRLNKTIEIAYPDEGARKTLFGLYLKKLQLDSDVNLLQLAQVTDGCSGADIKEICNQAGLNAFKRESAQGRSRNYLVSAQDLQLALNEFARPKAKVA
ncbi:MAG: 26S protease regulatory subunit, partial [Bdellovibrionales bacterium]|nr:26S protease regulatory subunit [Bdellovibrionales bacterium]